MLSEEQNLSFLEPFRHSKYPFLYIVEDTMAIQDTLKMFSDHLFGLETGFGDEPTRVFHINGEIPWLLTEPDANSFKDFKNYIGMHWVDLDFNKFTYEHPIIALQTYSTLNLERKAKILLYRNLKHSDMSMIPYEELVEDQRIVFVINRLHINEMTYYKAFLRKFGYNPDLLRLRDKSLPPLTRRYSFAPNEYVLDITK